MTTSRRRHYPANWPAIRADILQRADNRCEGSPAYPDCRAADGEPHPVTGSIVVLIVAHLDHITENCNPANLRVWCQRCHNTYDAADRRATRRSRKALGDLFEDTPPVGKIEPAE